MSSSDPPEPHAEDQFHPVVPGSSSATSGYRTDDLVPDPFSPETPSAPDPPAPSSSGVQPDFAANSPLVLDPTPPSTVQVPIFNSVPSSSSAFAPPPQDPTEFVVDPALFAAVAEFGYDAVITRLAIQRTHGASVEAAINWILDHVNDSDIDSGDGSSEDSESEGQVPDMGSAISSDAAASTLAMAARAIRPARTHKMVFVANMSLKMGTGKLAAQVGHACLGVYRVAARSQEGQEALEAWRRHGEVKIVVKGQSTEQLVDLFGQAKNLGLYSYLVMDAGYTQIPPGSRTVLGIFGPQELVDQVTGTLKLL